jgi:hypothetical protein
MDNINNNPDVENSSSSSSSSDDSEYDYSDCFEDNHNDASNDKIYIPKDNQVTSTINSIHQSPTIQNISSVRFSEEPIFKDEIDMEIEMELEPNKQFTSEYGKEISMIHKAIEYNAVVLNYSGVFVNDSYANWKSMLESMEELNICIKATHLLSYNEWRLAGCSSFDDYIFALNKDYLNMNFKSWTILKKLLYTSYIKHRHKYVNSMVFTLGVLNFIKRLDLFCIPWYIAIPHDYMNFKDVEMELGLICYLTKCPDLIKYLSKHLIPINNSDIDLKLGKPMMLENKALDRARKFMHICDQISFVKRKCNTIKHNDEILYIAQSIMECDMALQLKMCLWVAVYGSCDSSAIRNIFKVEILNEMIGFYDALKSNTGNIYNDNNNTNTNTNTNTANGDDSNSK